MGFAAGIASLMWQSVTWKLEGSRVKAELRIGALHENPGNLTVITYPARYPWSAVDGAGEHGHTRRSLFLTVRSVGRQPVTIERWVVAFPGGQKIYRMNSKLGPDLPHRLDVAEQSTWAIELSAISPGVALARKERVCKVLWHRRAVWVRTEVELGHGRNIRSSRRQRVRLDTAVRSRLINQSAADAGTTGIDYDWLPLQT